MEITLSDIISIVGLLAGGGGIGCWFTWRYSRRKEKAEAEQAETSAQKEKQDYYQQLLTDLQNHHEELRQERDHYKKERDELRDRLDKVDEELRTLKRDVARNGRQVEALRPFICADLKCQNRQRVAISDLETNNTSAQ